MSFLLHCSVFSSASQDDNINLWRWSFETKSAYELNEQKKKHRGEAQSSHATLLTCLLAGFLAGSLTYVACHNSNASILFTLLFSAHLSWFSRWFTVDMYSYIWYVYVCACLYVCVIIIFKHLPHLRSPPSASAFLSLLPLAFLTISPLLQIAIVLASATAIPRCSFFFHSAAHRRAMYDLWAINYCITQKIHK